MLQFLCEYLWIFILMQITLSRSKKGIICMVENCIWRWNGPKIDFPYLVILPCTIMYHKVMSWGHHINLYSYVWQGVHESMLCLLHSIRVSYGCYIPWEQGSQVFSEEFFFKGFFRFLPVKTLRFLPVFSVQNWKKPLFLHFCPDKTGKNCLFLFWLDKTGKKPLASQNPTW